MKPEIVFYRVRNEKFADGKSIIERTNYQAFIEGLNQYKIMNKAMTMMLNTDSMGFISLGMGVDAYAEPISGIVNQDIRPRRKNVEEEEITTQRFGRYFNPQDLLWWKFDAFDELYVNSEKVFPCECPECQVSKGGNLDNATKWNKFRRIHTVLARDKHVQELKESIKQSNVRGAMFDKVAKSKELITVKGYFS
jgi:hypothetical protein